MTPPLVRLTGIVRRFGPVEALAGASLELYAGEVHGVLGENGAGKTTLLNVLGGMQRPDGGRIELEGREITLSTPRDAWFHGIGLVHQHFTLVPALSVLENLALGHRSAWGGLRLPYAGIREAVEAAAEATGLRVPVDAKVEDLGVGDRQRVEILKGLLRSPRILVLDEPTAVLTPGEIETLFDLLRGLARGGCAVVLVAHKLDEILSVADRITVLRSGRTVATAPTAGVDAEFLVRAMVGEGSAGLALRRPPARGAGRARDEAVIRMTGVHVRGGGGGWALGDVSIDASRGEVVGIAGVEGNGQRELALVLSGRLTPERGTVCLPEGLGFVPQDRTTEGLIGDFDLAENIALGMLRDPTLRWGPFLRWGAIRERAEIIRVSYDVRAPGVDTRAGALSGGNQQRVVVGRELSVAADLLVAENPTRGLDIAATAFVHAELRRITGSGEGAPGVVLLSTDLDEILALSDRVFTIVGGELRAVPAELLTREGIGGMMLRGAVEAA